jgi:hypothetical protein
MTSRWLIAVLAAGVAMPAYADSFDLWTGRAHGPVVPHRHAVAEPDLGIPDVLPDRQNEKLKAKTRRVRGSSNPVYPAPLPKPDLFRPDVPLNAEPQLRTVQPYVVPPGTGQALPNINQGQRETSQDRAVRCAHQAGMYAGQAGDRGTYIGTCINQ